jgi:hypothetical protein
MSFRDGVTSSRAGSPGLAQFRTTAGFASGGGVAACAALGGVEAMGGAEGAALAVALAAAGVSPSRRTSVYERVRVTDAVQFCSWITNWYWPVSFIEIDESVADVVVTIVAWRGSFGGVLHRVRQKRPPPEAEWLVRERPGICSQHSPVLHARPAPEMESSPPISLI